MGFAGMPTAVQLGGIDFVTAAPAPMIEFVNKAMMNNSFKKQCV